MKLSTSLQKNILETAAGSILDRFLMRSRRLTLFFEDIIADYILTCEKAGRGEELSRLSQRWGELNVALLMPSPLKRLPYDVVVNDILKLSWGHLGIVDDMSMSKSGGCVIVRTKNESITRLIGENRFMEGFFSGVVNALFWSDSRLVHSTQDKASCSYEFEFFGGPPKVEGKTKSEYDRLNYLKPPKGLTLSDALKGDMLQLVDGRKLFFRGRRLTVTENTIFHLVGNSGIMLDSVPQSSHGFFKRVVSEDSTAEQKIALLKNLLQVMGWGTVTAMVKEDGAVVVEIANLPCGLQRENEDYSVLKSVMLGYLWLIDRGFRVVESRESQGHLRVTYGV